MNFRISNEFYHFTSHPPLKVIEPPPFFLCGGYRCTRTELKPLSRPRHKEAKLRESGSGRWLDFGGFPSDWFVILGVFPGFPFFAKEVWLTNWNGWQCGGVLGYSFSEMWMKFRCFCSVLKCVYSVGYLESTLALEIGSDFIWSRSEIWVCTLKCGRCCSRSAGSIQHSSTFRDDVCLTSDRTKIWKPTSQ